ncbi:MAG: Hint domain-containing protein, partial [Pseudomonadota bacterium]
MPTGFSGTFVISWSQTEIDGLEAAPVSGLAVGAAWSWSGDALLVDGAAGTLKLDRAEGADILRKRAAQMVHRLVGAALHPQNGFEPEQIWSDPQMADKSFVVTDGARSFTVTLIDVGRGAQPLVMFVDDIPPRHTDLWVVHQTIGARAEPSAEPDANGVICFTQGTRISTPAGAVPVEQLRVGDLVLTKDNGPQPIDWIGRRHMSGARLFAMPRLRPVRIRVGALGVERPDQELLVSPEHRMLLSGSVARDLFNTPEVLVAAKDLIDHRLVVKDPNVHSVTYIHLLLPDHNILWANGVATESFHPAGSALESLASADRAELLTRHPELRFDPYTYGRFARRNLSASEAALFIHAA